MRSGTECTRLYESDRMAELTGETLRPGGFSLTDIGILSCGLTPQDLVLDLGCGCGATVNYLQQKHNITSVGIDPSEKLIEAAKSSYGNDGFYLGRAEQLPFDDDMFDGVLAECTLSVMDSLDDALKQVYRVLKDKGWLVITDVYAKNPDALSGFGAYATGRCLSGMHDLGRLRDGLKQAGFFVVHWEDYSHYLKELLVKIVFSYGSLCAFWKTATEEWWGGDDYYQSMKQCKPGYFLMIARKKGVTDEG